MHCCRSWLFCFHKGRRKFYEKTNITRMFCMDSREIIGHLGRTEIQTRDTWGYMQRRMGNHMMLLQQEFTLNHPSPVLDVIASMHMPVLYSETMKSYSTMKHPFYFSTSWNSISVPDTRTLPEENRNLTG